MQKQITTKSDKMPRKAVVLPKFCKMNTADWNKGLKVSHNVQFTQNCLQINVVPTKISLSQTVSQKLVNEIIYGTS